MKAYDIVYWILNGLLLVSLVLSFILRRKTKKIINGMVKRSKDFVEMHNARLDLLSRENHKVREENEELKERLRNVGITDFDAIK